MLELWLSGKCTDPLSSGAHADYTNSNLTHIPS